jgi:hypothetical protein
VDWALIRCVDAAAGPGGHLRCVAHLRRGREAQELEQPGRQQLQEDAWRLP